MTRYVSVRQLDDAVAVMAERDWAASAVRCLWWPARRHDLTAADRRLLDWHRIGEHEYLPGVPYSVYPPEPAVLALLDGTAVGE